MTPPRGRRDERIARQLSERDWRVLHDVARVRLLSARQVERLHVHDGSPLTHARRARALTQRLFDLQLLTRLERRVGGVHAGSAGFVYGLSSMGQRLASGVGPAGGRRVRKPWEPSPPFVDHILGVSELYVRLRESELDKRLEGLVFEAEPACWRYWTGLGGERLVLKPDAFVQFGAGDYEYHYFVELDRSSQSRTVLQKKGETYARFFLSGVEQQRTGIFPRVLFVALSQGRVEQIVEALSGLDADFWRLFQVQTTKDAFEDVLSRPP
jgi:hypothetical protein